MLPNTLPDLLTLPVSQQRRLPIDPDPTNPDPTHRALRRHRRTAPRSGRGRAARGRPDPPPIKVGFSSAMTGPSAITGEGVKWAAQMLADEYNAKGGIMGRKIELYFGDNAGTPGEAVSAVRKLVDVDKVDVIIGQTHSGACLGALPVVKELAVPMVIEACSNPEDPRADRQDRQRVGLPRQPRRRDARQPVRQVHAPVTRRPCRSSPRTTTSGAGRPPPTTPRSRRSASSWCRRSSSTAARPTTAPCSRA